MLLITKYKAGNEIIQFFNKHLSLAKWLLPKNIEKELKFMDEMKIPLEFNKVFMIYHNDKDYFLYCQNLMNCVKNIIAFLI